MKNLTLVVLAAGMGSRFGGASGEKQITPVGPSNELLIDYAIYDALKAGFTDVVLVIKEDQVDFFNKQVISKWEEKINITYAIQSIDKYLPEKYKNSDRIKPWGTAHAILCTKESVKGNFVMINADDFYGFDSYQNIANYLKNVSEDSLDFTVVGYKLGNVISKTGEVKRGIIEENNGYLKKIIESKVSFFNDEKISAKPLNGSDECLVDCDTLTSLNMIGFTKKIFPILEREFPLFLENANDIKSDEFLIPNILFLSQEKDQANVKVIKTNSSWIGMTYKEEIPEVKNKIIDLVSKGEYPNNLYE